MQSKLIFKLNVGIQSYAWGKKGRSSLAAQLGEKSVVGFESDEEKTYAELWMGTHPTLPSTLTATSTLLSDHLEKHPELIGHKVLSAFPESKKGSLPFLFKVLSIGTALSIQAHPDKELAKKLFDERPDVYKDNNHKPEMAIALTPFLAFLNFLPLPQILLHLLTVPELSFIPFSLTNSLAASLSLPTTLPPDTSSFTSTDAPTEEQRQILKDIFEAFMSAPESVYKPAVRSLVERYEKNESLTPNEESLRELTLMLDEQYPGDVGVLCVFLLNVVELQVGQAAFLGANMPHAYISGDIIECMATSDNVVRAGLTPKLRDVPTLVSMLTYDAGPGSKQLLRPVKFSTNSELYDPPIDEFSVVKVSLGSAEIDEHKAVEGPSVVVVTSGRKTARRGRVEEEVLVEKGDVVFIACGTKIQWTAEDKLEAFRAFVEA
ncbi:hypothetical protein TREMEDRAFT_33152 [Tremella mesenterica DSM 1558]|uniref:uncharacterized protein n=1 Tax=Tremella mesenterica (strain ATCC 24925 / CBS 8224 / DSM 1558 / NBRC 9311 / NRRL Y-6157 / RJB 2259-6 / UBC 559-6) TaxID=578456 RepID=UPI0003F48BE4|nr:uncharacterized protein TREMEDRAFT_33152 [Tremella mesenterica DSM 1558]EIW68141.1 hypothetical protein TREMEDRAFT_33152 [Tremella mesenterica DSM 1558]